MNNSDTEDLLHGPGLEEPAIRKNLLPEWLKKLLLVLIFYKAYSVLRSVQLLLLLNTGSIDGAGGSLTLWISFLSLDLLEALVYITLLKQWKQAPLAGIIVLSVSAVVVIAYYVQFLMSPVVRSMGSFSSGVLMQGAISMISFILSVVIIFRLLKIRRAWVDGLPGK